MTENKYIDFEKAKEFALSLKLNTGSEWEQWIASNTIPSDIPRRPNRVYADLGWKGWSDFLGTKEKSRTNQKSKFRSFNEAKVFAQSLGFNTKQKWLDWSKSVARPKDIPIHAHEVYAKQWKGWGDFLGAEIIANRQRVFLSFEEAKKYVRSLGLKSETEWRAWAKSDLRPKNIPAGPSHKYSQEWQGWSDFLGTGNIANQNRRYRSFEQAKRFVQSLGFKSKSDWYAWSKTSARPKDIPGIPSRKYLEEWKGWGDFLGTGTVAPQNLEFKSFEEAKAYVRSLNIRSIAEWNAIAKSGKKQKGIPRSPAVVYSEEWQGWGDFLGTGAIATKDRKYKSFREVTSYARSLGFKKEREWRNWCKTDGKPKDIPAHPDRTYAKEWTGWGDFLGTGAVSCWNREFRPFEEARNFVQSLGLKNRHDWDSWSKSKSRPKDIPTSPGDVYRLDGWQGMGDWLGVVNRWDENNIRIFVSSLLPQLETLSPAGLYVIFQQAGLNVSCQNKHKAFLQAIKTGKFPKDELEKFVNGEESLVDEFISGSKFTLEDGKLDLNTSMEDLENTLSENEINIAGDYLPNVDVKEILATLDSQIFSNIDTEVMDFFIKEAVAKIWQRAYSNPEETFIKINQYEANGLYSSEVKRIFIEDFTQANQLGIPSGYSFQYLPNLMQRYTAYLVKSRKRIGNWSGTGAGKTLSAILASRVIDSKLTIICCPNNVVGNWEVNISKIYPDSIFVSKTIDVKKHSEDKHRYIILNYEFFQQPYAQSRLLRLLNEQSVDFVIIDEIHYSKQREVEKMSQRKKVIAAFLSEAYAKNENLHVLGMSATPVINNLFEGKTLIELVTGFHHDELKTKPSVDNCISLYQKFVSHGIRWLPEYNYQLNVHDDILIDCTELVPEIKKQSQLGSMVDLEIILTKAKIPFILANLKAKTIVYTHYVKDILLSLQSAIELQGWKVAIFTGENKSGLEAFIDGDADVLIASSCVGTGVDKLQFVCNRLIVNSLPWTHAEFEQLKGRIYRQGQIHDHVDVFVPLTFAMVNGEKWSWCESRWKRIQFKKSISDASVDGVIPEGHLRTPAQAYKDAMLWLERLERGEVYEIERRKILIPLMDDVKSTVKHRLGDLTQMNSRMNRKTSRETHKRFIEHPEEWEFYHAAYRQDRKEWPVIPYEEAIKWFNVEGRSHMVIGDFGCGEALLAASIPNKVYSFDHVAINDNVIACDMCHTSLDDAGLDAVVFSLSLMGANYIEYLQEAHRCLKLDGHLWIAEPTSRLRNIDEFKDLLFKLGFDVARVNEKWKFTFIRAIKSERQPNITAIESKNLKKILA